MSEREPAVFGTAAAVLIAAAALAAAIMTSDLGAEPLQPRGPPGADPPAASYQPVPRDGSEVPALPHVVPSGFQMPPLETYAEVLRRPLFSPDRRAHEPAQSPAMPPQPFTLRGIVFDGGNRYALIERGATTARVTEGQALGSATLARIMRDRIVLNRDGIETTVKVFDEQPTPEAASRHGATRGVLAETPPMFPIGPMMGPPR